VNEGGISMKLAMIGLGKMGMNMARRLMPDSHEIIAYDLSKEAVQEITAEGATGAASLQQVPFTDRVLSALRREFGGHAVVSKEE